MTIEELKKEFTKLIKNNINNDDISIVIYIVDFKSDENHLLADCCIPCAFEQIGIFILQNKIVHDKKESKDYSVN